MTRVRARVFGKVQGVGFRYFCEGAARERGIRGWVRNEPDGSVALEAEGGEAQVAEFLEFLKTGHPWARVKRIDAQLLAARDDGAEGFTIQH